MILEKCNSSWGKPSDYNYISEFREELILQRLHLQLHFSICQELNKYTFAVSKFRDSVGGPAIATLRIVIRYRDDPCANVIFLDFTDIFPWEKGQRRSTIGGRSKNTTT